jgi:benzylsuccinate CoA-transferase BbsE subunit
MLDHLRVLDLTDERGLLCGRLLADLGADVVQVEPAGGSTARSMPPLVSDTGESMYWATYAAGKRAIAVDLDDDAEVVVIRRLAEVADVVVTSWPRELLLRLGLDPTTLRRDRPELVYTVISAFGWTGPKADYADCDLVVWAAGGPLEPHRDGDRPPLRISVPQAYLHAAADAAAGTLIAVLARGTSGVGQVVDVSAQASLGVATLGRVLAHAVGDDHPEWHQQPVQRTDQSGSGAATPNSLKKWHCKDGMVELHLSMGAAAGGFTNNLFGWLADEAAVPPDIAAWDWRLVPDRIVAGELGQEDLERARAAVRAFLLTKTKAEVLDAAIERRLLCMAIFDMSDISGSPHLATRDYWTVLDIGGRMLRAPGRMAQVRGPEGPRPAPVVRRPAPRLDENRTEILFDWLAHDREPVHEVAT